MEKSEIKMCWTAHYVLLIYMVTTKSQLCENEARVSKLSPIFTSVSVA